MILTGEQVKKRLESDQNLVKMVDSIRGPNREIIVKSHAMNPRGPGDGVKDLTDEERESIGVLSKLAGSDVAAEIFGISENHASNLSCGLKRYAGKHVTDNNLKERIEDRLSSVRMTVEERAAEKLLAALGLLDNDKLENCNAVQLAGVASQMGNTMSKMRAKEGSENGNEKVKVIIHQPRPTTEEHFDCVEIGVK